MNSQNFQLILTQSNGVYAIPDIIITDDFETTFSIQNVADISQRKDSLSKNITFSGTKNNHRIFNNLYSFNRETNGSLSDSLFYNYSPVIGVKAVLMENNFPVFKGELKINDISKDKTTGAYTYIGIITGVTVSFFGSIQDKLLTDLPNFSDVIDYNWDNIQNSWVYSDAKKYVIPMIDYGKGIISNSQRFDIRNLRPAIYLREYISRILASQGYTYTSAFMATDVFKKAFIPYSEAEFGKVVFGYYGVGQTVAVSTAESNDSLKGAFGIRYGAFSSNSFVSITRAATVLQKFVGGSYPDRSYSVDHFTLLKSGITSAIITFSFTSSNSGDFNCQLLQIHDDGRSYESEPIDSVFFNITTTGQVYDVTLNLPYAQYQAGFQFAAVVTGTNLQDYTFNQTKSLANIGSNDAAIGSTFSLDFGDTFILSDAVPKDTTAVSLLKSILQLYNMYMMQNAAKENDFVIEDYNTFYGLSTSPVNNSSNWSRKIDNSSLHIKINTLLPKAYNFKFQEDEDYYNVLYKNTYSSVYGNFTINNSNGTAEAKSIDVAFSPTVIVKENSDEKTFPSIFSGTITDKKSFKSKMRILYNNGVQSCPPYMVSMASRNADAVSYQDKNPTTSTVYNTSHHTLKVGTINNFHLLFGLPEAVYYPADPTVYTIPTIYTGLYKKQLTELNDPNIFTLEVDVWLNESDISVLDLRKPIFIATTQGIAYFKIMSVNYYDSKEVSPVVLQKIIV